MGLLEAIGNALRIPELRRKILFTLGLFLVFRIFAHIAVPGADKARLDQLFHGNAFLGLLDLFSGGGLSQFSIIAMGVNPNINASIIMQLMTVVYNRMKDLTQEGESSRRSARYRSSQPSGWWAGVSTRDAARTSPFESTRPASSPSSSPSRSCSSRSSSATSWPAPPASGATSPWRCAPTGCRTVPTSQ